MEVTLNYTSKGLIHAIRTQLEQQKKEGKISGDTSYKKIVNCDFWEKINEINEKHEKNNKVFHGKGFSCGNKGQNTDWTKTIVVYGSTTFNEEEWEELLHSMGLQLTQKTEKEEVKTEEQPKVEETVKEQQQVEEITEEKAQPTPVEENKKEFSMPIATMAVLMTELQKAGYKNNVSATKIIQTELNCKVILTPNKELIIYNADGKKLTKKDENGNIIFSQELLQALDTQLSKKASQKAEAEKQAETVTNTETNIEEDENCTDDEE